MASNNQPIVDMFDMLNDDDLSLESKEVDEKQATFSETKLFRIYCTIGEGRSINLQSGRIYEWCEIVDVIMKFVEMVESYPGMTRSKEAFGGLEHTARAWEQWTLENYPELSSISSVSGNTKNFITQEDLLDITFSPPLSGDILINIAKKHRMKGLKELGVDAVVDNLKKVGDIEKLNLPSSLSEELKKEFRYYCEKFQVKKLKNIAGEAVWKNVDISKYMQLAMESIRENRLDCDWSEESDSDDDDDWRDESDSEYDHDDEDSIFQNLLLASNDQDIILDPHSEANYYSQRFRDLLGNYDDKNNV